LISASGAAALMLLAQAATAGGRPPDACTLASAQEVGALITPQGDVTVRTETEYPAAGEAACIWSAVKNGLTPDSPPEGSLSLAFYHFASAARPRRWSGWRRAPTPLVSCATMSTALRSAAR
jgi:hypothetical protein